MKFRVNISVRIYQGALNVQISVDTADSGVDSPVHSEKELFEVWERTWVSIWWNWTSDQ